MGTVARQQRIEVPSTRTRSPLWEVGWYGRERRPPGSRYWWDNQGRNHGSVVIQWTLAGELLYRDPRGDVRVQPGQAVLFTQPSDSSYGLPPDARATYVTEWVNLCGAGLPETWQALIDLHGPVRTLPEDGPVFRAMRRLCDLSDPRARTSPVTMATAVHAFVMLLWEGEGGATAGRRPVDQAIDAMLASPTAPWSLKRLADEHGISREHLARAFHERVGEPPASWLAAQRVSRAIALLTATELPIQAVRDQAGFTSSHTLIRRVRAVTGCSPLELRRRHQSHWHNTTEVE